MIEKYVTWRTVKIVFIIVCILTSFIIGYGIGQINKIDSVNGVYNIEITSGDKVNITTKLNYVERDNENNALIIYGVPAHEVNKKEQK